MRLTRRQVILGLLGASGGTLGVGGWKGARRAWAQAKGAPDAAGPIQPEQERALAAAVERLFPGAIEAGVPGYIRYWTERPPFDRLADWRPLLKIGAVHLDRVAQRDYQRAFADCNAEQQNTILWRFQEGKEPAKRFPSDLFFQRLLTLTLEGMFSDPKYGGNRGMAGWKLIGFHPCWWSPKRIRRALYHDEGAP
jgi:gluconate 2-dehydrogenase gamma chain